MLKFRNSTNPFPGYIGPKLLCLLDVPGNYDDDGCCVGEDLTVAPSLLVLLPSAPRKEETSNIQHI